MGLTMLIGAANSMGFIQLLAGPLEGISNLSVQVLAIQTTTMAAPLFVALLLLLKEGPELVSQGARLAQRRPHWLWRRWQQQARWLIPTAIGLVPYLLAPAMFAATLTKPELNTIAELRFLSGSLNPGILGLALIKTSLFVAMILWITLQQGWRARRLDLQAGAALSRAISFSIALVVGADLAWVLLLDPSVSGWVG